MSIQTRLTEDAALPALARALDPAFIGPLLSRTQHNGPRKGPPIAWSTEVLNHKVGRRCTIRYSPLADNYDEPPSLRPIVGKVYCDKVKARRVHDSIGTLRSALSGDWVGGGIPAPLGLLPDLGMVIQEYVDGVDLRHLFQANDWEPPLGQAAHWLASLHTTPIIGGLKTKSLEHELERAERWCAELSYISPTTQERSGRTLGRLRLMAERMGGYQETMIHRDFYDAQVLWDGARVWIVDFDQLALGDPALDLGHFVAHLASLAYRVTGRPDSWATQGRILVEAYQAWNPISIEPRLPFYKACTFMKLAANEARRKREGWQQSVSVLTAMACDELEAAPRHSH